MNVAWPSGYGQQRETSLKLQRCSQEAASARAKRGPRTRTEVAEIQLEGTFKMAQKIMQAARKVADACGLTNLTEDT